jgi:hypothetical protein
MSSHLLSISHFKTLSARLHHAVVVAHFLSEKAKVLEWQDEFLADLPAAEQARIHQMKEEFKTAFSDAQMDTASIRPEQIIAVQADLEWLINEFEGDCNQELCYDALKNIMKTLQIEISSSDLVNEAIDMKKVNAFYFAQSTGKNELQIFSVLGLYEENKVPFVDHELALNHYHAIGLSALFRKDDPCNPSWIAAVPGDLQINADYVDLRPDINYRTLASDDAYAMAGVDSNGGLVFAYGPHFDDGRPGFWAEHADKLETGFFFPKASSTQNMQFAAEKYAVDLSDILGPDLAAALADPGQSDSNPFGPPASPEVANSAEASMNP